MKLPLELKPFVRVGARRSKRAEQTLDLAGVLVQIRDARGAQVTVADLVRISSDLTVDVEQIETPADSSPGFGRSG